MRVQIEFDVELPSGEFSEDQIDERKHGKGR